MAKIDRLLLWMKLLTVPSPGISSEQYNMLCAAVEKRYPIKLERAGYYCDIGPLGSRNTKILLDYLDILEQEEK